MTWPEQTSRAEYLICMRVFPINTRPQSAPNGGSARSYQELSAPLAIPTRAEQAGGRMFMQR
jgi:hypothetical protein